MTKAKVNSVITKEYVKFIFDPIKTLSMVWIVTCLKARRFNLISYVN